MPQDLSNISLILIGSPMDGGYFMVDIGLENIKTIYTIGVNYDTKFENEFT